MLFNPLCSIFSHFSIVSLHFPIAFIFFIIRYDRKRKKVKPSGEEQKSSDSSNISKVNLIIIFFCSLPSPILETLILLLCSMYRDQHETRYIHVMWNGKQQTWLNSTERIDDEFHFDVKTTKPNLHSETKMKTSGDKVKESLRANFCGWDNDLWKD